MKKILDYAPMVAKKMFLICAILGTVGFTSCRPSARAAIAGLVAILDSGCPTDKGDGVRLMQVIVEDESVVFEVEIDEHKSGRSIWSYNRWEMYDKFSGDSKTEEIRKLLQSAKYNMVFRVTDSFWGNQRDILLYDWRQ